MPDRAPSSEEVKGSESTAPRGDLRRQLLVNADDFGWSRSINRGIVESHTNGIVTRASILATASDFEDAVALAQATPTLPLGVHLEMYRDRPLLPADRVRSLIGSDGAFIGSSSAIIRKLASGGIVLAEVEAEFRAQIERVKAAGITPSHLDSEKHLHLWPSLFDVVCGLALESGIPYVRIVREPLSPSVIPMGLSLLSARNLRVARGKGLLTADGSVGVAGSPTDPGSLERLLASARGRRVEFVVHPGLLDEEFWALQKLLPNKLTDERAAQLRTLTDPGARGMVERAGFELSTLLVQA